MLTECRRFDAPIPYRGAQGLFDVPKDVLTLPSPRGERKGPMPNLDDLEQLAARLAEAGFTVDLRIYADMPRWGARLCGYRARSYSGQWKPGPTALDALRAVAALPEVAERLEQ